MSIFHSNYKRVAGVVFAAGLSTLAACGDAGAIGSGTPGTQATTTQSSAVPQVDPVAAAKANFQDAGTQQLLAHAKNDPSCAQLAQDCATQVANLGDLANGNVDITKQSQVCAELVKEVQACCNSIAADPAGAASGLAGGAAGVAGAGAVPNIPIPSVP
jgi:hypothetical protein